MFKVVSGQSKSHATISSSLSRLTVSVAISKTNLHCARPFYGQFYKTFIRSQLQNFQQNAGPYSLSQSWSLFFCSRSFYFPFPLLLTPSHKVLLNAHSFDDDTSSPAFCIVWKATSIDVHFFSIKNILSKSLCCAKGGQSLENSSKQKQQQQQETTTTATITTTTA